MNLTTFLVGIRGRLSRPRRAGDFLSRGGVSTNQYARRMSPDQISRTSSTLLSVLSKVWRRWPSAGWVDQPARRADTGSWCDHVMGQRLPLRAAGLRLNRSTLICFAGRLRVVAGPHAFQYTCIRLRVSSSTGPLGGQRCVGGAPDALLCRIEDTLLPAFPAADLPRATLSRTTDVFGHCLDAAAALGALKPRLERTCRH